MVASHPRRGVSDWQVENWRQDDAAEREQQDRYLKLILTAVFILVLR
jgi:hypothetical protein